MKSDDEILRARARALARPAFAAPAEEARRALVVVCGGASFAVDLDACAEVLAAPAVTALPHSPDALAGLALVRGRVVACFRLAPLAGPPKKLVLLARDFALAVDDAGATVDYADGDVAEFDGDNATAVPTKGVLQGGLPLVDAARLLGDPRFFFPAH